MKRSDSAAKKRKIRREEDQSSSQRPRNVGEFEANNTGVTPRSVLPVLARRAQGQNQQTSSTSNLSEEHMQQLFASLARFPRGDTAQPSHRLEVGSTMPLAPTLPPSAQQSLLLEQFLQQQRAPLLLGGSIGPIYPSTREQLNINSLLHRATNTSSRSIINSNLPLSQFPGAALGLDLESVRRMHGRNQMPLLSQLGQTNTSISSSNHQAYFASESPFVAASRIADNLSRDALQANLLAMLRDDHRHLGIISGISRQSTPSAATISRQNPLSLLRGTERREETQQEQQQREQEQQPQHNTQPQAAVRNTGGELPLAGRIGHPPIPLYMKCDEEELAPYQCLVRQQIELFEADQVHANTNVRGRNRKIVVGQVGIRCRHCTVLPPKERKKAAIYYPAKLDRLYQACQSMASVHLCESCEHVPADIRAKLLRLKEDKVLALAGKKYWGESAKVKGVEETEEQGLRFV